LKLGISSACLYPEVLEESIKRLCDSGVKNIEIFLNTFCECKKSFLQELKKMTDDAGVNILSLHPFTSGFETFLFFTNYPRRFNDAVDMYKRYCECANILGSGILVFHGAKRDFKISYEEYFEKYGRLVDACAENGIAISHENIPRCISCCPEFFENMRKYLPNAKSVLDVKQTIRAGYTVDEMINAMGSSIAHVHISDHNKSADCLAIGKGSLDVLSFLNKLRDIDFDGGVIIELYRENFNDFSELYDCYKYLQSIYLKSINYSTKIDSNK